MAKIVLDPVGSGYNLTKINENFQAIEDELNDKVLYRDNPEGEPNTWETTQDANSQRLINLPDATSQSEPITLRQLQSGGIGLDEPVDAVGVSYRTSTVGSALDRKLWEFDTIGDMTSADYLKVGDVAVVGDRSNALFDTVLTSGVSPNGEDIVQNTATLTLSHVARKPKAIDVTSYGVLPGVGDCLSAVQNIISNYANHGRAIYFPAAGSLKYSFSDSIELTSAVSGISIFGDGENSKLALTGTHSSNKGLFYIPANGDSDGGTVDGADNVTIRGLMLDGSGATMSSGVSGGIRAFHGEGHVFENLWATGFTKQGILLQSVGSATVSYTVNNVYCYGQTGTSGHGISVATTVTDESLILINNAHCYDNDPSGTGIGIDVSTGSATLNNIYCYNNGAGGMKTAGNDEQVVKIHNADLSNNTNAGAQGFYTNGTFRLIQMSNVRAENNASHNIQIAHAGRFEGSNISCINGGDIGFYQSGAADSVISNLISEGNTARGAFISSGRSQIGQISTKENGRVGLLISTTDSCSVGSHISIDDCLTSDTNALFTQPASGGGKYTIGSVVAIDTGAGGVTTAVSFNSNTSQASVGKVHVSGVATAISDSGTNNVYWDANGRSQLPHDRIGFYGSAPVSKQTITGALSSVTDPNAQAVLTSIISLISTTNLGTDSTT